MREHQCLDHYIFGNFLRLTFDHYDRFFGACDDEIEL